jgi:signal transduction histidine kinase
MELTKSVTNLKRFNTPMTIDIGWAIIIAIFTVLNFALNKGNVFFRDIISYSAISLFLSIILVIFNYKKQVILLLIAAAAIFLGSVYGGIIGVTGIVCIWILLAVLNYNISRFIGIISALLVAATLGLYSIIWGKLIGATYFDWANWLVIIYSIYLCLRLFFIKAPTQIIVTTNTATQTSTQSQYFAEMSHEIRTPLNAILGFADTMQEELFGPLNDKYKEYIGYIQQSGHHLLDLVGDILDMSKIEAGKYNLNFADNDVVEICKSAVALMKENAARQKLSINFYGFGALIAKCDARSVRQIILNLISNAIKFTPEGGQINISSFGNDTKIWIEVSDTGKGMDADELKHITEAYVSGDNIPQNARSTGLGLSLVKKLVAFHNGKLSISSTQGIGTKVLIEIPKN